MTCGLGPCKNGNRIFPVLYGVPLFFVWMVFFIVGCILTGVSTSAPEEIQAYCDGESEDNVQWLKDTIAEIDTSLNDYSSSYMCSEECPCPKERITEWLELGEKKLKSFNRVVGHFTLPSVSDRRLQLGPSPTAAPNDDLNDHKLQDENDLFYLVDNRPEDSATDESPLYTNFKQCNEALKAKKEAWEIENPEPEEDEVNPYDTIPTGRTTDTAISFLSYFEKKYTCSGICNYALFYYSLSLEKGTPGTTCLSYLKTEIGESLTYLGVTSLVIGIVIMMIFVC